MSCGDYVEQLIYLNLELLIEYAERLGNGAVFKRLGFLLEKIASDETETSEQCRARLTAGNTKLDPKLSNEKLITRWRLWVPELKTGSG